ncbi:LmeA family phospholipid-binding protein [Streptomyces sp. NPDC012510]|uniref:LmeA family phospholipid-binding protein n=1 Tax=Streptomyces sp. NPDC012510 TaxID=3364838 RepID=UPI0036ECC61C
MRNPHRIDAPHRSDVPSDAPPDPHENPHENLYENPYDELGALDDGPLEDSPLEEFFGEAAAEQRAERKAEPEAEPEWTPPVHRRGGRRKRGRFAGLPLAVKAVVGLVVLASFLALADRWALLYAERRAADTLKDRLNLAAAPEVEIGGFPFLTQLVDKRLDSVRLTVPDVAADRVSLAKVAATAHDIRLEADGLTSLRGARVPRLDGDVLLSFADLNRELGASQVTFTGDGRDRVRAHGTLPVAGHDLRLRAEATIQRQGARGIATEIGGMRLDIGDLATYRPGTRASDGLHLTPKASADLARETRKAKALLSVPAIVRRMGVPETTVREALSDDGKLAELTGSPRFARQAQDLNLIDLALDNPEVLRGLGLDPDLLDALSRLTHPVLAERLSLSFELPEPERGDVRLRDVRVEDDGIRVRLTGSGLTVGSP